MKLNQFAILASALIGSLVASAQEVRISNGLNVSTNGPLQLVLTDMSLINYGLFKSDNGTLIFNGSANYSRAFIGGNAPLALHRLTIDLPAGDLQLQNNVLVSGNLTMTSGNVNLNNYSIDLGTTGRIEGESRSSRVTSQNGGFIRATSTLNAPQQLDPGNLGLRFTSDKNLGQTIILRGHTQQVNERGELSIARYYEVQPQFPADLQTRVVANFLDVESGNSNTNEIGLWSSSDGGSKWNAVSKNSNNYVLNESMNARPLRLTYFTGHDNAIAGAVLQLYPNPVTTKFTLAFTYSKQEQVIINLYNEHGQLLESKKIIPFNGLNKVDWDVSRFPNGNYQLNFVGGEHRSLLFTKQ